MRRWDVTESGLGGRREEVVLSLDVTESESGIGGGGI